MCCSPVPCAAASSLCIGWVLLMLLAPLRMGFQCTTAAWHSVLLQALTLLVEGDDGLGQCLPDGCKQLKGVCVSRLA